MASNFKFNTGGTITDFSDAFISRDLFSSGGLWNWGYNTTGALGDNTTVRKSSPVQTVAGGTNWKQVAGGQYFNVKKVIKTNLHEFLTFLEFKIDLAKEESKALKK